MKSEPVVPAAFRIAAKQSKDPERDVRIACRDAFRTTRIMERLIPLMEVGLDAEKCRDLGAYEGSIGPYMPQDASCHADDRD